MQVKSTVKLNMPRIKQLTRAAVVALKQTAEALHTEVVQAQVMPFDTGNLQNESTFVDTSEASSGKVSLVSSTPYARRLYYHPEYQFQKYENPFAGGKWLEPKRKTSGCAADICFSRAINERIACVSRQKSANARDS